MRRLLVGLALTLAVLSAAGQTVPGDAARRRTARKPPDGPAEFTFVRTIYNSPYRSRWRGSWATDFPEADYHFINGIRFWSDIHLNISQKPVQLEILDDRLFGYPLLYFVEPGYMQLSDEEAKRLREYVFRGGFLFLDDFWGDYEWDNVQEQMRKVFPEYRIDDLPLTHPLYRSYFTIDEVVQVPGIGSWVYRGVTHEKGGIVPHYMGIQDEKGRLLSFIARNCDLGDAWEWINDPQYPLKYGLAAYKVGVNVVIYAMTH